MRVPIVRCAASCSPYSVRPRGRSTGRTWTGMWAASRAGPSEGATGNAPEIDVPVATDNPRLSFDYWYDLASNDTASGRQMNRRVELVVSGSSIGTNAAVPVAQPSAIGTSVNPQ